jgi:hypothetical protein
MVPKYMFTQGYNVRSQIVMKRANIGAVLNFDLCGLHEGIFAFTQWPFRCCQPPQICTGSAEIFLCLNSADQLKVEPTHMYHLPVQYL